MPSCLRRWADLRRSLVVLGLALGGFWLGAGSLVAAGRKPFAPDDTPVRYAPARQFDLIHVKLDLGFDWEKREVSGTATEVLVPLRSGLSEVTFHGVALNVSRARLAGAAGDLAVSTDPAKETITLALDKAYGPSDRLEIAIDYSTHPKEGLYFVGPDAGYPKKPKQIWSQGESNMNRGWFPTWDEPGDRATSEMLATVPTSWTVVGNGRLVETVTRPDGRRTFHWQMDIPHSTYLTSIVAGELARVADAWHDIPIEYYVPPGREAQARVSFGKTPDMIDFFSTVTGRPYPYAKYAQTTAIDFRSGGMENISATTQTLSTLHDAADDEDFSSVSLVAHEAAHQWFGDLITCRDWSELWLNEGFASYFGDLYFEHDKGADQLAAELDDERSGYFAEDAENYRRPIVTAKYPDRDSLFDSTTYSKGALFLHMLRGTMGDEAFFAGIRHYVEKFAGQTVSTADFERSMEEATGWSLGPLFDGWVYGAGHPELAVHWEWSAEDHVAKLHVEQNQEIGAETGLFSFPLEIAWVGAAGVEIQRLSVEAKKTQDFVLPRAAKPDTMVIDPNGWLMAAVDFTKPAPEWISQLNAAPSLAALAPRLEAVRALAKLGGTEAIGALSETLRTGRHRALRAAAATALGDIATQDALPPLLAALSDHENEARTAVVEALGKFPYHPELIPVLVKRLATDPSVRVRAAAAEALGEFTGPGAHRAEAAAALLAALDPPSHREIVRDAAISSLAKLGEPRAWDRALRFATYGAPAQSRGSALAAIAVLGRTAGEISGDSAFAAKRKGEALRVLLSYLDDGDYRTRFGVYSALADLGDERALAALDRAATSGEDFFQRERARKSAIKLRESLENAGDLGGRLGRLEEESGKLRRDLETLRAEREGDVR